MQERDRGRVKKQMVIGKPKPEGQKERETGMKTERDMG